MISTSNGLFNLFVYAWKCKGIISGLGTVQMMSRRERFMAVSPKNINKIVIDTVGWFNSTIVAMMNYCNTSMVILKYADEEAITFDSFNLPAILLTKQLGVRTDLEKPKKRFVPSSFIPSHIKRWWRWEQEDWYWTASCQTVVRCDDGTDVARQYFC